MESDLILSSHPAYPDEEPYLEAKRYIERVEQKNNLCQEENHREGTIEQLETDCPDPLEHGASITMYPVRVPSMHINCATVQWDMPQPSADAPSRDSGSIDITSSYGLSMDWVVNPLSLDMPLLNQEDIIDLVTVEEPEQADFDSQHEGPATSLEVAACQFSDAQTEVNVCFTPSNEDDQEPLTETSQTSEVSDGELVNYEKNGDEKEDHLCTENPEIQVVPEILEALEEESLKTGNIVLISEAKEDVEEIKDVESSSEDGMISVIIMLPGEEECSTTPQSETNCPVIEVDSAQREEPDLIQEAYPPQPGAPPDLVCDAVNAIETEDSENVDLTIIANDEILELENAETFVETQECVLEVKQEEPTCKQQMEITVEVELHGHNEQFIQQQSKQELLIGEEPPEGSKRSSSSEAQTSDQERQTISVADVEASQTKNQKVEGLFVQSESFTETESTQLSEIKDGKEIEQENRTDSEHQNHDGERQTENVLSEHVTEEQQEESKDDKETNQSLEIQKIDQENHTDSKQLQNHDEDSERQTEKESSGHVAEEQQEESVDSANPIKKRNVTFVDREEACKLAERLYKLDNVQRTDVVRHLDKDNEFSHAVGEEYLKFFDFTNQSLDEALRSFLMQVVLIGETQERERVLDHFSRRYQQCNPATFSTAGAVLTLTCAVMLLNTDLHGQNVGKSMTMPLFVSNLDGMNEGENFNKDLLKTLYNSIKNHPLEWAVEDKELLTLNPDSDPDAPLRSKSNPFQDLAHDKKATVFQKGFLKRKAHADIDGKRTPWGKRSWKTFYAVLKGMVLYLQKDEYRKDWQSSEEVLSVHHALAERAQDYTKRPHVFRLQTADWRVFLFEAQSTEQMNSWIGRINLVSALYSSPPFPAAVGSQRKFCRPILPATQSALSMEKQLQSHAAMLQSFQEDLSELQQRVQESRRAKAKEVEEHRQKEEYLQHEQSRYEAYVHILDVWQVLGKSSETAGGTDLTLFDQELWKGADTEEKEDSDIDGGMIRSHSSPSLELEVATPPVVKVRRNISERRTYRKIIIPRRNREV
ncbi:PH and SEC7 domain-containing protein 1-like isoform X4 [Silurus asotus]|uniref:PH and SEC7 domain-containing protein 1-like isoform X4 n=1 Tax=Silurus asotus TaxID=30991 RepID=A0AAD5FH22_SILAS|nr:PH and SEC7 domain-containing protein 1-like isoform X4 [Silurus asotus]